MKEERVSVGRRGAGVPEHRMPGLAEAGEASPLKRVMEGMCWNK